MLNLNDNNHLLELGCRDGWSEKENVRPLENTTEAEELLLSEPSSDERHVTVPPASVYFTIELA